MISSNISISKVVYCFETICTIASYDIHIYRTKKAVKYKYTQPNKPNFSQKSNIKERYFIIQLLLSTGSSIYFGPQRKVVLHKCVAGIGKIILPKYLPGYRECLKYRFFKILPFISYLSCKFQRKAESCGGKLLFRIFKSY